MAKSLIPVRCQAREHSRNEAHHESHTSPLSELSHYWITRAWHWWVEKLVFFWWGFVILSCALIALAVYTDDKKISEHCQSTQAIVISTNQKYTVVQFYTSNGEIRFTQKQGISFPSNLSVGQRFVIDYDSENTDLVRVHGRKITLMIWPLLSVVLGSTIVTFLAIFFLQWLKNTDRVSDNSQWRSPWDYWLEFWRFIHTREEVINKTDFL